LSSEVQRVPHTRVAVCENGSGGDAAERLRRAIASGRRASRTHAVGTRDDRCAKDGPNRRSRGEIASKSGSAAIPALLCGNRALHALLATPDAYDSVGFQRSRLIHLEVVEQTRK